MFYHLLREQQGYIHAFNIEPFDISILYAEFPYFTSKVSKRISDIQQYIAHNITQSKTVNAIFHPEELDTLLHFICSAIDLKKRYASKTDSQDIFFQKAVNALKKAQYFLADKLS